MKKERWRNSLGALSRNARDRWFSLEPVPWRQAWREGAAGER